MDPINIPPINVSIFLPAPAGSVNYGLQIPIFPKPLTPTPLTPLTPAFCIRSLLTFFAALEAPVLGAARVPKAALFKAATVAN